MAVERKGAVKFKDKSLTLVGPEIKVGDRAPAFTSLTQDLSEFKSEELKGKPFLISTILSVATGICDAEIKRFNEAADKLGDRASFITISMDLPFSLSNWCAAAGVKSVKLLSDHRDASFAQAYGTLVKEMRVLARAVFVADKDGVVRYVEYLPSIGQHPDYDKALDAIRKLAQ